MRFFNQLRYFVHHSKSLPRDIQNMVIFGNNSIIFAALYALNHEENQSYPRITFVCPDHWLQGVHPSHLGNYWGQTMYGLPYPARKFLLRHRPNYPDNKFLEWGEYREIVQGGINELQQHKNVEFHFGNPAGVRVNKGRSFNVDLKDKEISLPEKSWFYLWYREPRLFHVARDTFLRPHTKLYEIPRDNLPAKVIIVGCSYSTVWLLKHCPNTIFFVLKRRADAFPTEIPSNAEVNIDYLRRAGRLIVYDLEDVELRSNGMTAAVLKKAAEEVLFEADIFSATGLVPNHSLLRHVPAEKKLIMPDLSEDQSAFQSLEKDKMRALLDDLFVAPRNVVAGSLAHSYSFLLGITGYDFTDEPGVYFQKNRHEFLKSEASKVGINLSAIFFDQLDAYIFSLDNSPDPGDFITECQRIFVRMQNPTSEELEVFSSFLQSFFDEKIRSHVHRDFGLR